MSKLPNGKPKKPDHNYTGKTCTACGGVGFSIVKTWPNAKLKLEKKTCKRCKGVGTV